MLKRLVAVVPMLALAVTRAGLIMGAVAAIEIVLFQVRRIFDDDDEFTVRDEVK